MISEDEDDDDYEDVDDDEDGFEDEDVSLYPLLILSRFEF